MMSKELIEELLKTEKLIDFVVILMNQKQKIERELWNEKVINHFLLLSGMSLEEFKNGCSVNGIKGVFIDDLTDNED